LAIGLSDLEVAKLLDLGMSDRARRIDTHVRFVDGTIYDGRPDFDDDECGKPLSMRRPCVIYKGVANAIKSYGDMIFGPSGFPGVTSAASEDDKKFEDEDGLNEKDSAQLDHVVGKIVDQSKLRLVGKQILAKAEAAGPVAILISIRAGKLRVSTIDAKNCEPEFDEDNPDRVVRLVISYRYVTKELDTADGKIKKHVYQYRRVIDAKADITYVPVEIRRETQFPTPSQEKEKIAHGFAYCPVHWYARGRDSSEDENQDGHPIHEGLLTTIDAVNQSLSQRHRAALYCGDPQIIETGTQDDEVRVPMGNAVERQLRTDDTSGWNEPMVGGGGNWRGTRNAQRKKGAGSVWRYEGDSAKVYYLALAGDALKALEDDAADNIAQLREALSYVHIDPDKLTGSGDISGKTLAYVCKQQIAACNTEREDVWTGCLLPVLGMLLRIALKQEKGLYLPGIRKVRPILERYERMVEGSTAGAWFDPPLRPIWPEYFEATAADEQATVTTVAAAKAGNLITAETAALKLRAVFQDINDATEYAEALKEEAAEKAQDALENAKAMAVIAKPDEGGAPSEPGTPPKNKKQPPRAVRTAA
jgi:hypothetical protein